jgi:hypothetical protein
LSVLPSPRSHARSNTTLVCFVWTLEAWRCMHEAFFSTLGWWICMYAPMWGARRAQKAMHDIFSDNGGFQNRMRAENFSIVPLASRIAAAIFTIAATQVTARPLAPP